MGQQSLVNIGVWIRELKTDVSRILQFWRVLPPKESNKWGLNGRLPSHPILLLSAFCVCLGPPLSCPRSAGKIQKNYEWVIFFKILCIKAFIYLTLILCWMPMCSSSANGHMAAERIVGRTRSCMWPQALPTLFAFLRGVVGSWSRADPWHLAEWCYVGHCEGDSPVLQQSRGDDPWVSLLLPDLATVGGWARLQQRSRVAPLSCPQIEAKASFRDHFPTPNSKVLRSSVWSWVREKHP